MQELFESNVAGSFVVAAFYKFVPLPDFTELRTPLRDLCALGGVHGTILLAPEGVNGTIAGPRHGVDAVLDSLRSDPRLSDLDHKESLADTMPFRRMKVRLKREIMGLGQPGSSPIRQVGQYVPAEDWNDLVADPDVLLIDTRNDYEIELGTFEGAVNPDIKTFRQFTDYVEKNLDSAVHKKVAMFCTGGIRCEKASSYMIDKGFPEVYHLQGGILKYLETVPAEESKWQGECFVFDKRVGVDHSLSQGQYGMCYGCGTPITEEDQKSEKYEEGVSCPRCHDKADDRKRSRAKERMLQVRLKEQRKTNSSDTDCPHS